MAKQYGNAPIVEAIIDFHVSNRPVTEQEYNDFSATVSDEFGKVEPLTHYNLGISKESNDIKSQINKVGVRLTNKNAERVILARSNGFTYSHLPKYSGWENFRNEAKKYWESYVNAFYPETIKRVAVRYINKINIPKNDGIKLEDYFNTYPTLPPGITDLIDGAYMQLQMPQRDLGNDFKAVLNLAIAEPETVDVVTIILDIDAFVEKMIEPTDSSVWEILESLRHRKNKIFEACIKDSVRDLIK